MAHRLMKTALIGALALASHGAFAQAAADKPAKALTSAEITSMLTSKGYTKVHDVKFGAECGPPMRAAAMARMWMCVSTR